MLREFKSKKFTDLPFMELLHLEILCGLPGANWKILAEDFQFFHRTISKIENSMSGNRSPVEEMFNLLKMRNPMLTLSIILHTLRELKINDSANVLEEIIVQKEEKKNGIEVIQQCEDHQYI